MKLSDIARLAGVSVTTASYVINGKAEQQRISPATVERVKAVVEHKTLGFILPDLENPSYARIAKLLEQGARSLGYQLLIASSDDDPGNCCSFSARAAVMPCWLPVACRPATKAIVTCSSKACPSSPSTGRWTPRFSVRWSAMTMTPACSLPAACYRPAHGISRCWGLARN